MFRHSFVLFILECCFIHVAFRFKKLEMGCNENSCFLCGNIAQLLLSRYVILDAEMLSCRQNIAGALKILCYLFEGFVACPIFINVDYDYSCGLMIALYILVYPYLVLCSSASFLIATSNSIISSV